VQLAQVQPAQPARKATAGRPVPQAQVLPGHKVQPAQPASEVQLALLDLLAHRVLLDHKVILAAPLVQLV
jgi:hypothetical protein